MHAEFSTSSLRTLKHALVEVIRLRRCNMHLQSASAASPSMLEATTKTQHQLPCRQANINCLMPDSNGDDDEMDDE